MLQDARERNVVEVALLVNGSFSEELVHLFVCESVAHGGQELPEVFLLDKSWNDRGDNMEQVKKYSAQDERHPSGGERLLSKTE